MLTLAQDNRQLISMAQTIVICTNRRPATGLPSCAQRGSEALADQLEQLIQSRDLPLTVTRSVCLGHCQEGPTARLAPGGEFLQYADLAGLQALADKALTNAAKS
ncbi:MAG: NADH:ubiquinone oxidoreductase subunit E [Candidatus Pseudothioglobus sp.]|jgi:NADH:ubiquinone oxidoreductase subunit E